MRTIYFILLTLLFRNFSHSQFLTKYGDIGVSFQNKSLLSKNEFFKKHTNYSFGLCYNSILTDIHSFPLSLSITKNNVVLNDTDEKLKNSKIDLEIGFRRYIGFLRLINYMSKYRFRTYFEIGIQNSFIGSKTKNNYEETNLIPNPRNYYLTPKIALGFEIRKTKQILYLNIEYYHDLIKTYKNSSNQYIGFKIIIPFIPHFLIHQFHLFQ